MTVAHLISKPANQAEPLECHTYREGAAGGPAGDLIVKYRSGSVDRFCGVHEAKAIELIRAVHSAGHFSGSVFISGPYRSAVINLAEVERISFRQDGAEDQS